MDEHNDGSGQLGPYFLATLGTFLGDIGIHAHRGTTHTAIFGVLIPVKQFLTFARLEIERTGQLVVTLAQTDHFETVAIRDRIIDTVGDDRGTVGHRGDVHLMRTALGGLFKQQVFFTENEIVCLRHY